VVPGIEDYSGNTTRFLLIGRRSPSRSGRDKTSLLLGLLDRPGALNDLLAIMARRNINLTRIESRPAKGGANWTYLFFIDLLGHFEEENIREACDQLRDSSSYFEWLGSYPQFRG
jgi:chorismate mutase / prephenate dehydratase